MIDLLKPIDLTIDDLKMLAETHKTWLNQVVADMQKENKRKKEIND